MKKKLLSQSAFFNLRALIGLLLVLAGVFLALSSTVALAQKNHFTPAKPSDPLVPALFDCSKIHEMGIDRQENLRAGAIMIACGQAEGGPAASSLGALVQGVKKLFAPLYGVTDKDLVTGTESSPNIVQSETYSTANPDDPNQIVVAYNDSRGRNASPTNISGASVSTDGGSTFTRLTAANGQGPFPNTFGDPVVLYNRPSGTWFTVWLDGGCGGQGLGGYRSTTPSDPSPTSWTHFCVHTNSQDDRESGWADNNPSSPFYGRMYVSWNDFNVGSGALFVSYSDNNGATWHSPIQVTNGNPFIRDVQITGDLATGVVYIAGMNEGGGGFPHTNSNLIYRSTDGGNTWTNTYNGAAASFPGPGVTAVGYFACMFPDGGGFWRHEGWGEPAAVNGVVSLVYSQHGTGSDPGDVYYIRSTDMGVTFSAPFKLNTDATTRPQWQPNLSVSPTGSLFATWYDARESTNCTKGNSAVPCYRMWSRKSNDNGATWLPDDTFSDVVSPLPGQSDPGIQATYAGDYDYGSAVITRHLKSFVDGRVPIGGASQQDAFFDGEIIGFSVTSTVPAVGSVVSTQPTDFTVNVTDAVDPATLQPSDFTVNGIPANTDNYTPGSTTIHFIFNSTPVTTQGLQTMHVPAGAFNKASGGDPVLDFTGTFRYDALLLQVTTTNPPVGGTFSPPAPGTYQYDVNWNEPVDSTSVQTSDLMVGGTAAATVTGVTVINSNMTTRFTLNIPFGGSLTANIAAGAIADQFGNPGAAFSGSYTVLGCPPQNHYDIAQIGGSIVPGTTDIGNHIDDGVTTITLPFGYNLYGTNYTTINLSSNGNAQFTTSDTAYSNVCLPWASHNSTILPYWDDLKTDANPGCSAYPGGTCGIYTSVSGTAPNRIFNIEWRAVYFSNTSQRANHELRLYEGQSRFDVIYGTVDQANSSATAGVQRDDSTFDQYFCSGSGGAATGGQSYTLQTCAPVAISAVSRKTHGGAGTFDIDLPSTGSPGIEDRTGPVAGEHQVVVTFASAVTVAGASVTTGTGTVSSFTVNGAVVTVNLAGVTDAQVITITLSNVDNGQNVGDVLVPMAVLLGDTNASGSVNGSDVSQTKSQSGQPASMGNFRTDVNTNGTINGSDVSLVKSRSGAALP
ncbi:MAG TPA: dockerin type I domain-containing protein [Chthoniobacterales bacterium]